MRWLMRLFRQGVDVSVPDHAAHVRETRVTEEKLTKAEHRWASQRQRVDPVLEEVERVQKLMRDRHARTH